MNITKEYLCQVMVECAKKSEKRRQRLKELFDINFTKSLNGFTLYGLGVEKVGNKENNDNLFHKFCNESDIKPIYEYRECETRAEKIRFFNSTYGVYHFNDTSGLITIRVDISNNCKPVPDHLASLRNGKCKPKCLVDIELFERVPLQEASMNWELKEFIEGYNVGMFTREELEALGSLKTLEDVEKIHMMFLVFEDNSYILAFLGLGNNEPYSIREKSEGFGKNRFYRYSLVDGIEQISDVVPKGENLSIDKDEALFIDYTSDGKVFGLLNDFGVIIQAGAHWKKAEIKQTQKAITPEFEIKRQLALPYLSNKLRTMFPQFSSYAQVFYDPLERVKSFGHLKSIQLLIDKGVLGAGWQSRLNVASDLFIHGHNDGIRIKPITLLLYHFIELGELEKIIVATADSTVIKPLKN